MILLRSSIPFLRENGTRTKTMAENPNLRSLGTSTTHADATFCLFALGESVDLGRDTARLLGRELNRHEDRAFEDGEHKSRALDHVAGKEIFVIQGLHGGASASPNDKLLRLLFFVAVYGMPARLESRS
jgi:hypothetical protein